MNKTLFSGRRVPPFFVLPHVAYRRELDGEVL